MDSVDLSVLRTLREWQAWEQPLWLVTVVETFGSSPRQPGAMLALCGDGLAASYEARRFGLPFDGETLG